ncbi:hypothetical protein CCACVL1_03918 [Corchorus capsularis]|uniref:Uncharacterized protein n=1 Tax=Corchorus capsularis TaxID=210143 RepID=A0A1R3JWC2_COCAP|nr:hypothetical protein CCACVL1_03918 [Corchorus capsularis]
MEDVRGKEGEVSGGLGFSIEM